MNRADDDNDVNLRGWNRRSARNEGRLWLPPRSLTFFNRLSYHGVVVDTIRFGRVVVETSRLRRYGKASVQLAIERFLVPGVPLSRPCGEYMWIFPLFSLLRVDLPSPVKPSALSLIDRISVVKRPTPPLRILYQVTSCGLALES